MSQVNVYFYKLNVGFPLEIYLSKGFIFIIETFLFCVHYKVDTVNISLKMPSMRARELSDVFNHSTKPHTKCQDEMSSLFILVMDGNIYLTTSVLCNCFLLIETFPSGGKTEIDKTQKPHKTERL